MVRTTFTPGSPVPVTVIVFPTISPLEGEVMVPEVGGMVSFLITLGLEVSELPAGSVNVAVTMRAPSDKDEMFTR